MTKKTFAVIVVLFLGSYFGLASYLDRPTVEVSVDKGHCVRAYGPNGTMSCEDAMSGAYERVFVDPKRFKKVLHG